MQKGDGGWIDFSSWTFPRLAAVTLGTGNKRSMSTAAQEEAVKAGMINVMSMTSGPDGSIFVGDYNLIRRITPEGKVETVIDLG